MITRDFRELKLSALGFGAMRLPVIDGRDDRIDREETFRMVDEAMAKGITPKRSWAKRCAGIPGTATASPRSSPDTTSAICRR